MSANKNSIFPGIILIFIGSLLLINKITPYYFSWYEIYPLILIGIGLLLIFSILNKVDKGAIFPGTILLLVGVFFFLRNYDIMPYYYLSDFWPIFLIIFGLAFFAVFVTKPSDWGVLIPGCLFLFLGVIFFLKIYRIIYWEIWEIVGQYWPVILIVIGGSIILGSLKKGKSEDET